MSNKKEKFNKQQPMWQTDRTEESWLDKSDHSVRYELREQSEKKIGKGNAQWH